ncbi:hypothetical protein ACFY93_02080 [Streptomyces sp. NPDC008313]|uniref:hypothetical protein n=1 Tax=Streptomyces sp. NPDC008313 TaxID=3364826 RepID=UPI0036E96F1B
MTTDLSALTTAADRWEGMAERFHKQEVAYKRDVHGIVMGDSWAGLSADAAHARFGITLKEFQKAQTEAKAVASLLREAHTLFTSLRGELQSTRQDATDAGMKVSDQGLVTFDTEKLTDAERTAWVHDPDYQESCRKAVGSWQEAIDQRVKKVGSADNEVKRALQGVTVDGDVADGTPAGFNGQAGGHLEQYAPAPPKPATTQPDGWYDNGPDAGFSVTTDPKYGKEGSVKAYADLWHVTGRGTLTNGDFTLAGISDTYYGARATANYGFNEKGVVGKAEVSAGLRTVAEGRGEYGPYGGAYVRTEGFAGGEAGVNAKITKEEVTVGAKAFAGGKASVAGGGEVAGIGIGATAEGWAGPGAEAWYGYKKDDDGVWHLGGKAGLSPILGGSVGVEITVDPDKISETAGDAVDALGDATDAVGDGLSSLKDGVTDWF